VRSHSQERAEREKHRERERQRQKDALAREEEEYEERQRAKKQRERDRVYRDVSKCVSVWGAGGLCEGCEGRKNVGVCCGSRCRGEKRRVVSLLLILLFV